MSEDLNREEVTQGVDRLVEELLAAAGIVKPPVDAIALARQHLGLEVDLDQARGKRPGGRKDHFLRPEPTEERRQWTVAHEIGTHLKPTLLQRLGIPPEQTRVLMGESLANLVAYRLLVPTCWLADEARLCDHDVLELKKRFPTASHEVVAWRLLDLSTPCIITIVDNEQVQRRRSNAWRITRELADPEKSCLRYVHHYSRPRLVSEQGWTVHGWPVHQSDWKREILRSIVDEETLFNCA